MNGATENGALPPGESGAWWTPVTAAISTLIFMVVGLRLMGRVVWCSCGSLAPWTSDTVSRHNSQHLFDPYSLSHGLHGMMFLAWLQPFARWIPMRWRLYLVVLAEAVWEIIENTPYTIERYRTATVSLGYTGDSIINSLGDVLCCYLGAQVARKLGWTWGILLFLGVELLLLLWIKDCLILNMVMLLYPIEAIKKWQLGG
jgi:hypothetical protein